jgi:hypothetical protein
MTEKATTVTRAGTANITGLNLRQNYITLRHEDPGPITNTNLALFDSTDDADINFTLFGSDLELLNGNSLLITSTTTYSAGGLLTLPGNFTNLGTFTHNNGAIRFTSSTTGRTITTNNSPLNNVVFKNADGGWTLQDNLTIDGTLTIKQGILSASSHNITFTGDGEPFIYPYKTSFVPGTGTVTFLSTGTTSITADRFTNLVINGTLGNFNFTEGKSPWLIERDIIRPSINWMRAVSCDDTHCYGAHDSGYMSKVLKSDGTIIWDTNVRPNTNLMYGISCDDTHCYGAHASGYMSKVLKSDGTIIWDTNVRPNTSAMNGISCDDTHCYGAHDSGYMSKVLKSDGTVIWSTGVQPSTNNMNGISCDDTHCYGAHASGYMSKVLKSDGTVIWSTGVQPNTNNMNGISCDDTHCYGAPYFGIHVQGLKIRRYCHLEHRCPAKHKHHVRRLLRRYPLLRRPCLRLHVQGLKIR